MSYFLNWLRVCIDYFLTLCRSIELWKYQAGPPFSTYSSYSAKICTQADWSIINIYIVQIPNYIFFL
jgi:hypothetical protein